jgi:type II secretory pathway component PulF
MNKKSSVNKLSSAYRADLFSSLQSDDVNLNTLARLYQVMGDGERVAERAELEAMAQQFAEGQDALLSTLQGSQRFLPWELEMMRVGLATGQLQKVFSWLTSHYIHQQHCWEILKRCLMKAVMILSITLFVMAGYAVYLQILSPLMAMASVVFTLLLMSLSAWAGYLGWQSWQAATSSLQWDKFLLRLPILGEMLRLRQTYLFLSHLELALISGLGFPQSLRLAERRLLASPFKDGFARLARFVLDGKSFSRALLDQGYLRNVNLGSLPPGSDSLAALALLSCGVLARYRLMLEVAVEWLPLLLAVYLPVYAVFLLII